MSVSHVGYHASAPPAPQETHPSYHAPPWNAGAFLNGRRAPEHARRIVVRSVGIGRNESSGHGDHDKVTTIETRRLEGRDLSVRIGNLATVIPATIRRGRPGHVGALVSGLVGRIREPVVEPLRDQPLQGHGGRIAVGGVRHGASGTSRR